MRAISRRIGGPRAMMFDKRLNNIQVTRNFNLREFQSPDTGAVKMYIPLIHKLQEIRDLISEPMQVLSGYRTQQYNSTLKYAVKNSAHLYGLAADIRIQSGKYEILAEFARCAGIQRIKIYPVGSEFGKGWIHLGYNTYPLA